jgi:hypothetical protein
MVKNDGFWGSQKNRPLFFFPIFFHIEKNFLWKGFSGRVFAFFQKSAKNGQKMHFLHPKFDPLTIFIV